MDNQIHSNSIYFLRLEFFILNENQAWSENFVSFTRIVVDILQQFQYYVICALMPLNRSDKFNPLKKLVTRETFRQLEQLKCELKIAMNLRVIMTKISEVNHFNI